MENMTRPALTGNINYRVQSWTGKLILQVEEIQYTDNFSPLYIDTREIKVWRDAIVSDLVNLERLKKE